MNVIFAGTPDFAAAHLQVLIDSPQHSVIAVYTQPDRPAGRGKSFAQPGEGTGDGPQSPGLPAPIPEDPQQQQILSELQADIMVVVAYGLILPQSVLDIPKQGCINVHGSILPRWRGAAPIQRAIEAGDEETGVTIMQMDAGLDTGAMLSVARCQIESTDNSASLFKKLEGLGADALLSTLENIEDGKALGVAQDESQSNYATKISKQEALIDWSKPAALLDRQIRAFNPFPTAYTNLGDLRIKLWQAELGSESGQIPGQIIRADNSGILVSCGELSLLLTEIQLPGNPVCRCRKSSSPGLELFTPQTLLGC